MLNNQNAKVAWVNSQGEPCYGIARHIVAGPDNFGFLQGDVDVRDGYLRITSRTGFDHAISVRALMAMSGRGEFTHYDW